MPPVNRLPLVRGTWVYVLRRTLLLGTGKLHVEARRPFTHVHTEALPKPRS